MGSTSLNSLQQMPRTSRGLSIPVPGATRLQNWLRGIMAMSAYGIGVTGRYQRQRTHMHNGRQRACDCQRHLANNSRSFGGLLRDERTRARSSLLRYSHGSQVKAAPGRACGLENMTPRSASSSGRSRDFADERKAHDHETNLACSRGVWN